METMVRAIGLAGLPMLAACGLGQTEVHSVPVAGTFDAVPAPASAISAIAGIREALGSVEGFAIESTGIDIRLGASGCESFVEGLLMCSDDVRLQVSIPGEQLQQTVRPAAVILKAGSLLYRGPLHPDDKPDSHSLVISDVNADGHEDLMLWSGREGAYGGPSFEVYLFHEGERQFRLSEPFSDLTIGYLGLFGVSGRSLTVDAQNGCCVHVRETYVVEADAPKLFERITTETAANGTSKVITERVVDGELQIVSDE